MPYLQMNVPAFLLLCLCIPLFVMKSWDLMSEKQQHLRVIKLINKISLKVRVCLEFCLVSGQQYLIGTN